MLGEGEGLLCSSQGLLKEDVQAVQIAAVTVLEFFGIARSYSLGGAGVASSRAPQEAMQKWEERHENCQRFVRLRSVDVSYDHCLERQELEELKGSKAEP